MNSLVYAHVSNESQNKAKEHLERWVGGYDTIFEELEIPHESVIHTKE
jgi:hypothetical protein